MSPGRQPRMTMKFWSSCLCLLPECWHFNHVSPCQARINHSYRKIPSAKCHQTKPQHTVNHGKSCWHCFIFLSQNKKKMSWIQHHQKFRTQIKGISHSKVILNYMCMLSVVYTIICPWIEMTQNYNFRIVFSV